MSFTPQDVDEAQKTLKHWEATAKARRQEEALRKIRQIRRVLEGLIGK